MNVQHEVLFASEIDKFARKAYLLLHPGVQKMFTDMKARDPEYFVPDLDLYVAGIPCQAFSIAGNRKGELDPRGTLFYNSYQVIKKNRPRWFVIENVKGLLSDDEGRTFNKWIDLLAKSVNGTFPMFPYQDPNYPNLGYHIHWAVLNTMDYGLPQTRSRVFIVGVRDDADTFQFPKPEPLLLRLRDMLEPAVDRKYFVSMKAINFIMREDRIQKRHTQVNGDIALTHTAKGQQNWTGDFICVPEATEKGYDIARPGDAINLRFPNSKTRRGRVGKGISPTIETDMQIAVITDKEEDPRIIVDGKLWDSQSGKVYNENGIAPTLMAGTHGYNMGYIQPELTKIGDMYENGSDAGRVYDVDGVACTLKSEGGGGGAKTGLYMVDQVNDNKESGGAQPYQQNRVYDADGLMPAITAELNGRNNILFKDRIRKLTPLETFRLQGFPDQCAYLLHDNKMSDSQLYRQSGNSISIPVIVGIFNNLFKNIKQ